MPDWSAWAGQTMADRPSVQVLSGPVAVTSLLVGLFTWPLAFNLGAYGTVFYDDVFALVVSSSILVVLTVVYRPFGRMGNWVTALALSGPLAWLVVALLVNGSASGALDRPVFAWAAALIIVVSVPLTLRLLFELFYPEMTSPARHRQRLGIVALVAAVALVGFLVGSNNDRVMRCSDFTIAGSDVPDNCKGD